MNTLLKLLSFGKKYWFVFSIAFFSMILSGFISLLPPWLVKIAVEWFFNNKPWDKEKVINTVAKLYYSAVVKG